MLQPNIDTHLIAELKELLEDEFVDVIELFLRDAESKVSDLSKYNAERDFSSLRRAAHSLKGASANVGAVYFSRLCSELEAAAMSVDWSLINQLTATIQKELEIISPAYQRLI